MAMDPQVTKHELYELTFNLACLGEVDALAQAVRMGASPTYS
jgi:hypothetical protein